MEVASGRMRTDTRDTDKPQQHRDETETNGRQVRESKKRNSQVVWQEEKETGRREEQEQPIKLSVWAGGFFRV